MTRPQFSPLALESLLVDSLRYYFGSGQTTPMKLVWDADPKISSIEINAAADFHKVALQEKPRIIVDRGAYMVQKSGLNNSMMQQKTFAETGGLIDRKSIYFAQGSATLTIDARQKGVCEAITELAGRFISWSSPLLCSALGFKELGMPMSVSPCQITNPEGEGEMFTVTISLPYIREDVWRVWNDGIKFKSFLLEVLASNGVIDSSTS
jgi:hypothetical protein